MTHRGTHLVLRYDANLGDHSDLSANSLGGLGGCEFAHERTPTHAHAYARTLLHKHAHTPHTHDHTHMRTSAPSVAQHARGRAEPASPRTRSITGDLH